MKLIVRTFFCAMLFPALLAAQDVRAFELASRDFPANGRIPAAHTCDGGNLSPHLAWSGAPSGTQSFALICHDPDAPSGDFVHWIVCDIPAAATEIPRGGPLPAGAQQLANDFGRPGYGGPCPPSGTHRYVFTLYALPMPRLGPTDRTTVFRTLAAQHIGMATVTGLYARQR